MKAKCLEQDQWDRVPCYSPSPSSMFGPEQPTHHQPRVQEPQVAPVSSALSSGLCALSPKPECLSGSLPPKCTGVTVAASRGLPGVGSPGGGGLRCLPSRGGCGPCHLLTLRDHGILPIRCGLWLPEELSRSNNCSCEGLALLLHSRVPGAGQELIPPSSLY